MSFRTTMHFFIKAIDRVTNKDKAPGVRTENKKEEEVKYMLQFYHESLLTASLHSAILPVKRLNVLIALSRRSVV